MLIASPWYHCTCFSSVVCISCNVLLIVRDLLRPGFGVLARVFQRSIGRSFISGWCWVLCDISSHVWPLSGSLISLGGSWKNYRPLREFIRIIVLDPLFCQCYSNFNSFIVSWILLWWKLLFISFLDALRFRKGRINDCCFFLGSLASIPGFVF